MSDYEQYIGKARFISAEGDIESLCKSICERELFKMRTYDDSYRELLSDEGYKKYIILDDGVYEIFDKKEIDDYDDIFHAEKNADGDVEFVLRYYNGGCGFSEAFGQALKNMKKK